MLHVSRSLPPHSQTFPGPREYHTRRRSGNRQHNNPVDLRRVASREVALFQRRTYCGAETEAELWKPDSDLSATIALPLALSDGLDRPDASR